MRRLLADALGETGLRRRASACEDGDQALAVCTTLRPDVLTLDLAMPGLDGIGVLRALRDSGLADPGRRRVGVLAGTRRPGRRRSGRGRRRAGRKAVGRRTPQPTSSRELGDKVRARRRLAPVAAAGSNGAGRFAHSGHARAGPAPRRPYASADGRDRLLDRRPAGAGRAAPAAACPARRRRADRPAHAGRLHRLAGRRGSTRRKLHVGRGGRERRRSTRERRCWRPGGSHLRLDRPQSQPVAQRRGRRSAACGPAPT